MNHSWEVGERVQPQPRRLDIKQSTKSLSSAFGKVVFSWSLHQTFVERARTPRVFGDKFGDEFVTKFSDKLGDH